MEELLKQVLKEVQEVKANMATKQDVKEIIEKTISEQQKDILAMLQIINFKLDSGQYKIVK